VTPVPLRPRARCGHAVQRSRRRLRRSKLITCVMSSTRGRGPRRRWRRASTRGPTRSRASERSRAFWTCCRASPRSSRMLPQSLRGVSFARPSCAVFAERTNTSASPRSSSLSFSTSDRASFRRDRPRSGLDLPLLRLDGALAGVTDPRSRCSDERGRRLRRRGWREQHRLAVLGNALQDAIDLRRGKGPEDPPLRGASLGPQAKRAKQANILRGHTGPPLRPVETYQISAGVRVLFSARRTLCWTWLPSRSIAS